MSAARAVAVAVLLAGLVVATPLRAEWLEVDYAAIVDGRALSHSGEPVSALLRRLGGRPLPRDGSRPADRLTHSLLDPLLEPYAFVLSDALETLEPWTGAPLIELGSLWLPGEPQPAWVELLRARRYVVESDGAGRLRVLLPAPPGVESSAEAARRGWDAHWPVLRHVLAAERRRLAAGRTAAAPPLGVVVHAYRHHPERTVFDLGRTGHTVRVDDTRPSGTRPPLDLERLERFLASGLRLEGARLDNDGALRLFGSRDDAPSSLLGRPLDLSDLAVAYRAVSHGGLAEPYMSLDRGYSPQTSVVSYGGRLRDTALGLVSLLCDVRFKTFSMGLDIVSGADLRERLRRTVPEFRTHLERFAEHPDSLTVGGQQTRLWFYPDQVDLTVAPQGDLLALRRVRMTAASERADGQAQGEDPPWTRATVAAVNRDYDALAAVFPEMADLDTVVRLLSLFTWLEQARADGLALPELEPLLAVELPAVPTPRSFPQLLAFNALPRPGAGTSVAVFDRVSTVEALDVLGGGGSPLPPRRRLERAVAALDPEDATQARFLAELQGYERERLGVAELDFLAYRAERLRMHRLVLSTLGAGDRVELMRRQAAGDALRVFSVAIGGLDLGMGRAMQRAGARRLGLAGGHVASTSGSAPSDAVKPGSGEPREAWRVDPPGLAVLDVPPHGGVVAAAAPGHRVEVGKDAAGLRSIFTVYAADAPEPRSRRVTLDAKGRVDAVVRLEGARRHVFRFERTDDRFEAQRVADASPGLAPADEAPAVPAGLALLTVGPLASDPRSETGSVPLTLESTVVGLPTRLETDFPRTQLQRLILGRRADLVPGSPLRGLDPLPEMLGKPGAAMLLLLPESRLAPWDATVVRPGEEDPPRIAAALNAWWAGQDRPAAVVGVDRVRSPERWLAAPAVHGPATLVLPADGFPPPHGDLRARLARAWDGPVVDMPGGAAPEGNLIVLASAEAPARFAGRLRRMATDPALDGRLLAAWCLSGPIRGDLPPALLESGRLAGLAVAEGSIVGLREAESALADMSRAVAAGDRPERLPGPFLWYY